MIVILNACIVLSALRNTFTSVNSSDPHNFVKQAWQVLLGSLFLRWRKLWLEPAYHHFGCAQLARPAQL